MHVPEMAELGSSQCSVIGQEQLRDNVILAEHHGRSTAALGACQPTLLTEVL